MWGNYIGALFVRDEFGLEADYPFDESWEHDNDEALSSDLLSERRNWFNPGFLRRVDDIEDITTAEIYDCLSATSITSFVEKLKTKTVNDEDIDIAYNAYNDWPE